ncbi:MAG: cell division protein ZapE [Burkholderiales bacterium]|nr:cell division protein ZapE [Burkholderiales bacterium]
MSQVQSKELDFDIIQLDILQQLDEFINKFNSQGLFSSLFKKPKHLGYYIYGLVGRGKSMIMNELFRVFPENLKQRIHFHEFMYNVHQQLAQLKAHEEPLKIVAKQMRQQFKIIFLDEMTVNDIASAMILKNLFSSLFNEGIYIITTSNDSPDNLYPDGLMRERFLPAIKLIRDKLIVLCLDGANDYRLRNNSFNNLFIIKNDNHLQSLSEIFTKISENFSVQNSATITIAERQIPFVKKSYDIIWFNFDIICGDNRSQLDYLELIKQFEWFIIDSIHTIKDNNIARRFTWLIDILYDNQCKLAISSTVDIAEIYPVGELISEFARTKSRLLEMQTKEYLTKPAFN